MQLEGCFPVALGIFLEQGLNLCPLFWQAIPNPWTIRECLVGEILTSVDEILSQVLAESVPEQKGLLSQRC